MPSARAITLAERFAITAPYSEFEACLGAGIRRLEREGIPELRSMSFWTSADHSEASAVIEFSDAERVIEHMQMISGWDELRALGGMIRLLEMRVHGPLPAAAEAWIRQFGDCVFRFDSLVAGFHR